MLRFIPQDLSQILLSLNLLKNRRFSFRYFIFVFLFYKKRNSFVNLISLIFMNAQQHCCTAAFPLFPMFKLESIESKLSLIFPFWIFFRKQNSCSCQLTRNLLNFNSDGSKIKKRCIRDLSLSK